MSAVRAFYQARVAAITSFLEEVRFQITDVRDSSYVSKHPLTLCELVAVEERELKALAEAKSYVAGIEGAIAAATAAADKAGADQDTRARSHSYDDDVDMTEDIPTAAAVFKASNYRNTYVEDRDQDGDSDMSENGPSAHSPSHVGTGYENTYPAKEVHMNDYSDDDEDEVFEDAVEFQPGGSVPAIAEHHQPANKTTATSPTTTYARTPTEQEKRQHLAATLRKAKIEAAADLKSKRADAKAYADSSTVVIAQAPHELTAQDVYDMFNQFHVLDIRVSKNKALKRTSGAILSAPTTATNNSLVLVRLDSPEIALSAVAALDNTIIHGKAVHVHMKSIQFNAAKRSACEGPDQAHEDEEHFVKFQMARKADQDERDEEAPFVRRAPRATLRKRANHDEVAAVAACKAKRPVEATLFAVLAVPGVTADARPTPSKRRCVGKIAFEPRQGRVEADGETVNWGKRLRR